MLRECLPVKSVAAVGADQPHPRVSLPGLSGSFAAAFALMRSAADEARTILSDCLPVKSVRDLHRITQANSRIVPNSVGPGAVRRGCSERDPVGLPASSEVFPNLPQ